MKIFRRLPLVALCSAAITCTAPLSANAELGKVLFTNGDVRIVGIDGQSRTAKRGDIVSAGERLITGTGAMSQVKMTDGGRIGLREVSRVRFEKKVGSDQPLTLVGGAIRVLNVKIGAKLPPKMIVKTRDGQVDLSRGDAIAALSKPRDATKPSQTLVKLNGGDATAKLATGQQKALAVREVSSFAQGSIVFATRGGNTLAEFEGPIPKKTLPSSIGSKRESVLGTPLSSLRAPKLALARKSGVNAPALKTVSLRTSKLGGPLVAKQPTLAMLKPTTTLKPIATLRTPIALTNTPVLVVKTIAPLIPKTTIKPVIKQLPPTTLTKKNRRLRRRR